MAAKTTLGYWDYVKAAFRRRLRVPLLGAMPVNQMGLAVFALLGFANPGFWLLGAAAELTYLVALSSSGRFQKLVSGEQLLVAKQTWEERVRATVARLTPEGRERYKRLLNQCRRILGLSEQLDVEGLGDLHDLRVGSLNQLLVIFLRLLTTREVTIDNLRQVDPAGLEREVERLRKRLDQVDADRDAALARSLRGTLEIQSKRLENLRRGRSGLEVIDAEMQRIEQQVQLIREEAAVSGRPEFLSERLDAITSTMAETSRWMDANAEMLGSATTDDLGAPEGELPDLAGRSESEG